MEVPIVELSVPSAALNHFYFSIKMCIIIILSLIVALYNK